MPLTRRQLVLAKVEAAYATDPTHAVTDAQLVHDFSLTFNGENYARAVLSPTLSPIRASVLGKRSVTITFWQEIRGNAGEYDATTVPEYDVFLRACGMSAVYAGGGPTWTYAPRSSGYESCAIEAEIDGVVVQALGCRGNAVLNFVPGERGRIEYTFQGLYTLPADRAMSTPNYTTDIAPPIVAATGYQPWAENPAAGVFGHVRSLVVDFRNQVVPRESLTAGAEGIAGFEIVGRGTVDDPGMSATLEVEQKAHANGDDFFTRYNARTTAGSASVQVGSAAHNQHTFTLAGMFIEEVQFGDLDGRVGNVLDCRLVGTGSGDNEITLVTT